MDAMCATAKKHNLKVSDDAAHAIGTDYRGRKIGQFGDVTVFSFYATKTITTAEGGMVVTMSDELGDRLRRFSYFGVDKDAFNRYTDKGTWYYEVVDLGFKYNMDNIQGALGVAQLKKIESFIAKRRALSSLYNHLLRDIEGLKAPVEKSYTRHTYHLYPVVMDQKKLGISRSDLISKLREWNVGSSVHFIPLHLHPWYQKTYGYKRGDFPVAESLFDNEVSLPLYPGMSEDDVRYVVDAIKEITKK
jgi:dTDP-4-amino-4,6-dideoxygalactose transaminase